jgi:hypothetical protein
VQRASDGDRVHASALLAQLLEEFPYGFTDLLVRYAPVGSDTSRSVGSILSTLAEHPGYESQARYALACLGMADSSPEYPAPADDEIATLELPGSWFAGHEDPVRDHTLFLRYLPELRARVSWRVPPVRVTTDEELEPDGFRITVSGEIREGRVDPTARYCPTETISLLPTEVGAASKYDDASGLQAIRGNAVSDHDSLTDLLTFPAVELVVRFVGELTELLPGSDATP